MEMEIIVFEKGKRDHRFYSFVGRLALDRNVTKEMHDLQYGSIYDDPGSATWLLAEVSGKTVGCCAFYERKKDVFLDNTYVLEDHRKNGIGIALFKSRLGLAKSLNMPIKTITKNPIQARIYERFGFELASKRGKYLWYQLKNGGKNG